MADSVFHVGSIEGQLASQNEAIANVNSDENLTNDILADALNCTKTTFFKGSGSNYTGTVPVSDYKYATFMVNVRDANRTVIAESSTGGIATNGYNGVQWAGWKQLAEKMKTTYTLEDGKSLTIPVPRAYIVITSANMGGCLSVVVGNGYGAESTRHKINILIDSSSITYTRSTTGYGLIVSNSTGQTITIVVTSLY